MIVPARFQHLFKHNADLGDFEVDPLALVVAMTVGTNHRWTGR